MLRSSAICETCCNEGLRKMIKTHGKSGSRIYWVWRDMLNRCQLPSNKSWKNYGGRGIRVCTRWDESFQNFWSDMESGYRLGLTLERLDNSQGYSPENCVWADRVAQARNTRRNHIIETPWGRIPIIEAAERSGINSEAIRGRLRMGWSEMDAVTTPKRRSSRE